MTEHKFTAGEWSVDPRYPAVASDKYLPNSFVPAYIANCSFGCRPEAENRANAQLMSAAPDLLDACQELLDASNGIRDPIMARDKAIAAIRKATSADPFAA